MKENLYLRPATVDDARLIFEWANDPEVRENSFNTDDILWDDHLAWFNRTLADESTLLFILMKDDAPVGQVRLVNSDKWQISYSIASVYRGQGYGKLILQLAENELVVEGHGGEKLYAEVKMDNIASQKIFTGLDYWMSESEHVGALAYVKIVGN
ncbi:MAG: GNAT family N-acetyltransferase [Anaerovibrio sp.]|uniref:GNAT family N-acetyltransferase n=1 Tax=Anaerovibrio sp. TaxID=1872532 RepID=UPI0025C6F69B|nr:GNAT family N-acetyltransferase [Anaerovibrio sp.]MBE6099365.1 GNAT family N-acetyltransferase [Anaerovibrio sp.]